MRWATFIFVYCDGAEYRVFKRIDPGRIQFWGNNGGRLRLDIANRDITSLGSKAKLDIYHITAST